MVSVRRVVPVFLLAVAIPIFGAPKKSSSHPPRDLHRVGDYWTAYKPPDPATSPAASIPYTINPGVTPWTLAQPAFKHAHMPPQFSARHTCGTACQCNHP